MEDLGLKQKDIMRALGVTRGSVGHYLSGRRSMSADQAKMLAKVLGMSMDELFGDEQPANQIRESNAAEYKAGKVFRVPVIDASLAAGAGCHVDNEEVVGYRAVPMQELISTNTDPQMARIVTVKGDSMSSTFLDGDAVLVNSDDTELADGKVFAFEVDGHLRIKRFMKTLTGQWRVVSDNPDKNMYPPEIINDGDNIRIIGRVVALVFRRL